MAKRNLIIVLILLGMYGVSAGDVTTFTEDFESYSVGTCPPAPNWSGAGMASAAQATVCVDVDSQGVYHSPTKVYHVYRDGISLGTGGSCSLTSTASADIRYSSDDGVYVYTAWAYLGSKNSLGAVTQISSRLNFYTLDSTSNVGSMVGFKLDGHYNNPRSVLYYNGSTLQTISLGGTIPVDAWLKVETTVDEINNKWGFSITTSSGAAVYSASELAFYSSSFTQMNNIRVYFESNSSNDAFNNRIDDISVVAVGVPEPATMCLLTAGGILCLIRKKR